MKKNDKVILFMILGVALLVVIIAVYEQILDADFMKSDKDNDGFSNQYEIEHVMNPFVYNDIKVKRSIVENLQDYTQDDLVSLNSNEYYPLEMAYNDENKQVISISGVFSKIKVDSPLAAIYSLYNVKTLVGLTVPEEQLKYRSTFQSESGMSYTFLQYHEGIEIWGRSLTVSVENSGRVTSLRSSVISSDILEKVSLNAQITEKDARAIAFKEYEDTEVISEQRILYIAENNEIPELAYVVVLSNYEVFIISAYSGEILSQYTDVVT